MKDSFEISVGGPLAWRPWIWIVLPFLLVMGGGCGSKTSSTANDGNNPPAPSTDPVAIARGHLAQGPGYAEVAIADLKDTQNPEALEILLSILKIPMTTYDFAPHAIKALGAWKTDHDRIAEALVARVPELTGGGIMETCRVLAAWNIRQHSPELIRGILESKKCTLNEPLVSLLRKIITPECSTVLIAALPSPSELGRFPGGPQNAMWIFELLDECPDAAATPKLLEHLNDTQSSLMCRPASVALGRIGTEEAVAAIEKRLLGQASNEEFAREIRAGLHRSHHPRGRAVLAESLQSKDVWTRADAADGLAETATAEDAALVSSVLSNPYPQMRLRVFSALPRLLPDGRSAVEQMYDGAIQANRFRTALKIAEALSDKDRISKATAGLDGLRQSVLQEPRLDQWFGKRQDELKKEFADGEVKEGSLGLISIGVGGSSTSRMWNLTTKSGHLKFGAGTFGGACDGVAVLEGYEHGAYGAHLGDPGDATWEILGGDERNKGIWGQLISPIEIAKDKRVELHWAMDQEGKVSGIEVHAGKQ